MLNDKHLYVLIYERNVAARVKHRKFSSHAAAISGTHAIPTEFLDLWNNFQCGT
jgi:hypothetical protein